MRREWALGGSGGLWPVGERSGYLWGLASHSKVFGEEKEKRQCRLLKVHVYHPSESMYWDKRGGIVMIFQNSLVPIYTLWSPNR